MAKIITLPIAGEQRTLNVGNVAFTRRLTEAGIEDPFNIPYKTFSDQYAFIVAMIYAGLNTAGASVTVDQVREWVDNMELEELGAIATAYADATTAKTGEALTQAANG